MNYNEGACAQAPAPRSSQVGEELSHLSAAVAELHEALEVLYQRLAAVTVPADAAKSGCTSSLAVASSPLAQELSARATMVDSATGRIRNLTFCLDI